MPASSPSPPTPRRRAPSTTPFAWASPSRACPARRRPSASIPRRSCASLATARPRSRLSKSPARWVRIGHGQPLPHLCRVLAVLSRRTRQAVDAGRALRRHHRLGGGADLGDREPGLVVADRRAVVRLPAGLVPAFPHREEQARNLCVPP